MPPRYRLPYRSRPKLVEDETDAEKIDEDEDLPSFLRRKPKPKTQAPETKLKSHKPGGPAATQASPAKQSRKTADQPSTKETKTSQSFPTVVELEFTNWTFRKGLDPKVSGPITWNFNHLASAFNTGDPFLQQEAIHHARANFTCPVCTDDMRRYIERVPFLLSEAQKVSKETKQPNSYAAKWWIDLHNDVNYRNKKPRMDHDAAIAYWFQQFKLFPTLLIRSLIQVWAMAAERQLDRSTTYTKVWKRVKVNNAQELEAVKLRQGSPLAAYVYFILFQNYLDPSETYGRTGVKEFIEIARKHKLYDKDLYRPPPGKPFSPDRFLMVLRQVEAEWNTVMDITSGSSNPSLPPKQMAKPAKRAWGWTPMLQRQVFGSAKQMQSVFPPTPQS